MDKRIDLLYQGLQELDYVQTVSHGYLILYSSIIQYSERHSLVENLNIINVFLDKLEKDGKLEVVRETFDPDLIAGVRLK